MKRWRAVKLLLKRQFMAVTQDAVPAAGKLPRANVLTYPLTQRK
jgi:hypothetical protein